MSSFSTSALASSILAASALFAAHGVALADNQTAKSDRVAHGNPTSLTQVLASVEAAGYTHIREVEWDDGHYEVDARNAQGQRVELDVHPVSGKVLRVKLED